MKNLLIAALLLAAGTSNAQMGIGTTSPNSTLDVRGSFSTNFRTITSSSTATATDQAIIFTGSSAATLTLPDATLCLGRNYTVKNASSTLPVPVLTLNTTASQLINNAQTYLVKQTNEAVTLTSNGSGWEVIYSGFSSRRDNQVVVKSESDLPAPVGGIITLLPAILYELNGSVTVSNKINLNGSWLTGKDIVNDIIIYTAASGELFTGGANGGNIRNLSMIAPNAGTKLFNVDGGGANKNLIIQNCYFLSNNDIGLIKGYGGNVYLQTNGFFYNKNGITFENCNNLLVNNSLWDNSNQNTYEKYLGTFSVIQKVQGAMQLLSVNSAKGIDISGITSLTSGELKQVFFMGTGTKVVGSFSKNWEVFTNGLQTEIDDVASGNLYLTIDSITNFSGPNSPTKVKGGTVSTGLFRVESPIDNRLVYAGTKNRRFQVIASLSITAQSANQFYTLYIAKNGVILPESRQGLKLGSGVDKGTGTLSCTVPLSPNDYLEVWVANDNNNTGVTIESLNLAIK